MKKYGNELGFIAYNCYQFVLLTFLVRKTYDLDIIKNISLNITNFH